MGITLRQALNSNCLGDASILSGHKGIDKEIRMVNVMEVPDIFNWVSPDELLVTTGYPFKDSLQEFPKLIIRLHNKGVAGMAIKLNRFIKELPRDAIELSNKLDFPIIALPFDTQMDKIIHELMTKIINQDYYTLKKSNEIHKTLTSIVQGGGNLEEIAQALSNLCFGEITIRDVSGNVLAETKPDKNAPYFLSMGRGDGYSQESQVKLGEQLLAFIIFRSWRREVEKEDLIAIDFASTIIAMLMFKIETKKERDKRHLNDFLNNLLLCKRLSKELTVQQGKSFGIDLDISYYLFVVNNKSYEDDSEHIRLESMDSLENHINNSFWFNIKKCVCWNNSNEIIILFPASEKNSGKEKVIAAADEIRKIIKKPLYSSNITIGISRCYSDITDIIKAYREAQQAGQIGMLLYDGEGVYHYDDLGIYQLLSNFPSGEEIKRFVDGSLGKLIAYDRKKKSELLPTLEYLLRGDNVKQIAEKLYIHPKTLTFRKGRIEEILDLSLSDPEKRITLSVAIKLHRLCEHQQSNKAHSGEL